MQYHDFFYRDTKLISDNLREGRLRPLSMRRDTSIHYDGTCLLYADTRTLKGSKGRGTFGAKTANLHV